jgi:hypothetical protein
MTRTRTLIIVIALAIVAAACSPSESTSAVASLESATSPSESSDTTADPLIDAESAMIAFTQCLRDQGIEVGDPTVGSDGSLQLPPIEFVVEGSSTEGEEPDFSAFEDKIAQCDDLLGSVGSVGSNSDSVGFEDAFVEYTQCMRDNGVDMPDPDFSNGGGVIDLSIGGADGGDFEAADAICRSAFESLSIGE